MKTNFTLDECLQLATRLQVNYSPQQLLITANSIICLCDERLDEIKTKLLADLGYETH